MAQATVPLFWPMLAAAIIQAIATSVLVFITWRYARDTGKLARVAEAQMTQSREELEQLRKQAEVAQHQLKLEYDPNLRLTGEISRDGSEVKFRLVNLGRYPLWLDGAMSTGFSNAGIAELLGLGVGSTDERRVLLPGNVTTIRVFEKTTLLNPEGRGSLPIPDVRIPSFVAKVEVRFAYGSTGPWIHTREWKVTLQNDSVKRVYIHQIGPMPDPIPY